MYMYIQWIILIIRTHPLLDSEAEIRLTLRNSGNEAYKASDYGRTITVVRQIRRDGGSTYKLKAANGQETLVLLYYLYMYTSPW